MAMHPYETILFEKLGNIAHVSLNRPSSLNAFNIQMRDDFSEALGLVDYDDDVRSLIITGQGRSFCAGADLTEFGSAPSQAIARQVRWERDVWGQLHGLNVPTIAAVHGYCIGSGVETMLLCDLRIAADDTVFSMPELHLGMIPAAGGSQTLLRNANASATLDLLLTGRRISADEALAMGLITRVAPVPDLLRQAWDLAARLAEVPGISCGYVKQAIRDSLDLPLGEGLEMEKRLATLVQSSERSGNRT